MAVDVPARLDAAYALVDPNSVLTWQHDWTIWLAEGDTIATRLWSISPLNGTSPETPTLSDQDTDTVTVQGMQAGKVYRLTERITTGDGLTDDRTVVLRCDNR